MKLLKALKPESAENVRMSLLITLGLSKYQQNHQCTEECVKDFSQILSGEESQISFIGHCAILEATDIVRAGQFGGAYPYMVVPDLQYMNLSAREGASIYDFFKIDIRRWEKLIAL